MTDTRLRHDLQSELTLNSTISIGLWTQETLPKQFRALLERYQSEVESEVESEYQSEYESEYGSNDYLPIAEPPPANWDDTPPISIELRQAQPLRVEYEYAFMTREQPPKSAGWNPFTEDTDTPQHPPPDNDEARAAGSTFQSPPPPPNRDQEPKHRPLTGKSIFEYARSKIDESKYLLGNGFSADISKTMR